MTEIEALKTLEDLQRLLTNYRHISKELTEANGMAIQALEEIQQYRAIGTVDDYWKLNEMCKEYSAIGTIEEFKAFKLGRLGNKGFITIGQTIEEFKEEIRNKAIDEFKHKLLTCNDKDNLRMMIPYEYIYKVAEDMKGVQE